MGYKNITIKSISDRLKISQGTISKALRDDASVKSSTRKKIIKTAKILGYDWDWRKNAKTQAKNLQATERLSGSSFRDVTMNDIAARLGLSSATVSRALNNPGKVKPKTVEKVKNLAVAMGYTINPDAKLLRNKSETNDATGLTNVTIYTVAGKLGISPSTVSRAFVNNSGVSSKTRLKVLNTANEMGLILDESARNLRRNKTQVIGIIVSRLDCSEVQQTISGIEKALKLTGYHIVITNIGNSSGTELNKRILTLFNTSDGIVIIPSSSTDSSLLMEQQISSHKPVIVLGSFIPGRNIPRITVDQRKAVYELTRRLIGKGCRRIFYVDPTYDNYNFAQRTEGYKQAFKEAALTFDKKLLLNSGNQSLLCHSCLANLKADAIIMADQFISKPSFNIFSNAAGDTIKEIYYVEFEIGSLGKSDAHAVNKLCYNYEELGAAGAGFLINDLISSHSRPKNIFSAYQLITIS